MTKNKIIKITAIIILLIITISPTINAWDDCPFGLENEPYPGTCPRYTDTNNDGLCDHSQSEPTEETQEQNTEAVSNAQQQKNSNKNRFPILLIVSFMIIVGLILILRYLTKTETISKVKEKIIWNILLLIFFLPTAITGVILLLTTNLGILRELGLSFIQIHTITSLFFMWISAYHIIWHTKYYTKAIRNLSTKNK